MAAVPRGRKAAPKKAGLVTEAALQDAIVEMAQRFGWRAAHFGTARTGKGAWVTPVRYQGAGYPDLVLVRERVVYVEVKGARGRVSDAQQAWLAALGRAGAETHVWRPKDWPDGVERVLRRDSTARVAA